MAAGFGTRGERFTSIVEIWQGGESEKALCFRRPVPPPSPLCFEANGEETTRFFEAVRENLLHPKGQKRGFLYRPARPRAMPRIGRYTDFSKLDEISTAAAVVLAADYERAALIVGEVPPTVELASWNDGVFKKLFQIGFFEIVGLSEAPPGRMIEDGETMTMRIVSAQNADDLARIDQGLQQLGRFLGGNDSLPDEVLIPFLTALSEAITNVTNHAYPEELRFRYQHINRFWVAATASRADGSLTIVVYDQGATIPFTYPRISRMEKVRRFLSRAIKAVPGYEYENDGTYIRAALRFGGSRTDQKHRGKGLPQIIETLDRTGVGSVRIRSRGGWCIRTSDGRVRSGALSYSVGGTLIEWSVSLH